jgi:hypothetical protein
MADVFPFSLAQVRERFGAALYPASFVVRDGAAYWLQKGGAGKELAVLAEPEHPILARFQGEQHEFGDGYALRLCPTNHANARALRAALPWLQPTLLGLATSAGFGDRLGLATPGHVRALDRVRREAPGSVIMPIFAQQSIREMERTRRSPDDVLADATWGTFQEGWRGPIGADADHLKTPADIDICAAVGFTFFTIDPGASVDGEAEQATPAMLEAKVTALPWQNLESTPADLRRRYAGATLRIEGSDIHLDTLAVLRAAAKYGRALAHVVTMARHLASKGIPHELEISVDETETPTTPVEHIYIASELKRLGVRWVSLAPRYVGRFEKGVDYIGDLRALAQELTVHAAIARALGPYKLSLHSGSDKFSVYPLIAEAAQGLVHLKTAGTSYLEALRVVAQAEPTLFREIVSFARERYPQDRASYHVSAELSRMPALTDLPDSRLAEVLENFDARQVLHVAFGSISGRFGPQLLEVLRTHEEAYYAALEHHFHRHLKPFARTVTSKS